MKANLKRRLGEWKVGLDPFHLHIAEYRVHHAFQCVLKVFEHLCDCLVVVLYAELLPRKNTHAVHLMEAKIMTRIDRIASVDISGIQKSSVAFTEQGSLMSCHVGTKESSVVNIIGVVSGSADMIQWSK
jgi:hypothetical protein